MCLWLPSECRPASLESQPWWQKAAACCACPALPVLLACSAWEQRTSEICTQEEQGESAGGIQGCSEGRFLLFWPPCLQRKESKRLSQGITPGAGKQHPGGPFRYSNWSAELEEIILIIAAIPQLISVFKSSKTHFFAYNLNLL